MQREKKENEKEKGKGIFGPLQGQWKKDERFSCFDNRSKRDDGDDDERRMKENRKRGDVGCQDRMQRQDSRGKESHCLRGNERVDP